MSELRYANERFRRGDPLSDEQLNKLINSYTSLRENLDAINEQAFELFGIEVSRRLILLVGFQRARKERS